MQQARKKTTADVGATIFQYPLVLEYLKRRKLSKVGKENNPINPKANPPK
jgi:hypothetical protein